MAGTRKAGKRFKIKNVVGVWSALGVEELYVCLGVYREG